MLHDMWTRSVSVLYLLCWARHLSDCASRIREEREKGGWKWDFIEHSVSVENPGLAHFETSPWPNPIKCFEGWQVQSVSSWLLLTSWVQFRRKASGLRLSQKQKRSSVGEKLPDEEQEKTEKTMFLLLFRYLDGILFFYCIIKIAPFHHSNKTICL